MHVHVLLNPLFTVILGKLSCIYRHHMILANLKNSNGFKEAGTALKDQDQSAKLSDEVPFADLD